MVCLNRPWQFKLFKGCLPQILIGPFLNTLSRIYIQSQKKIQTASSQDSHFQQVFFLCEDMLSYELLSLSLVINGPVDVTSVFLIPENVYVSQIKHW